MRQTAIAIGIILLHVNTIIAGDDETLRKAFEEGVLQSSQVVDSLQRSWHHESSSGRVDVLKSNGDQWDNLPDSKFEFSCSLHGKMAIKSSLIQGEIESIYAINDNYAFQVNRAHKRKSWTIEFVERLGNDSARDIQINELKTTYLGMGLGTWYVFRMPLNNLITSPDFKFKGARKFKDPRGNELVRIEFDHLVDNPIRKASRVSEGYLVSDPNRYWALKEYGGTIWSGGNYKCQVEWNEKVDGFPQPSRLLITTISDRLPKNTEFHMLNRITDIRSEVPSEPFFLSHYGFPEPVFETSWLSVWMKYLLAGIICVAIAYGIKRRRAAV